MTGQRARYDGGAGRRAGGQLLLTRPRRRKITMETPNLKLQLIASTAGLAGHLYDSQSEIVTFYGHIQGEEEFERTNPSYAMNNAPKAHVSWGLLERLPIQEAAARVKALPFRSSDSEPAVQQTQRFTPAIRKTDWIKK